MADPLVSVNVSLPQSMRTFLRARMREGGCANLSKFVRHLIRQEQRAADVERVQALLEEGLARGTKEMDAAEWASISAEARARVHREKPSHRNR